MEICLKCESNINIAWPCVVSECIKLTEYIAECINTTAFQLISCSLSIYKNST